MSQETQQPDGISGGTAASDNPPIPLSGHESDLTPREACSTPWAVFGVVLIWIVSVACLFILHIIPHVGFMSSFSEFKTPQEGAGKVAMRDFVTSLTFNQGEIRKMQATPSP